jgi:hypothetical protein
MAGLPSDWMVLSQASTSSGSPCESPCLRALIFWPWKWMVYFFSLSSFVARSSPPRGHRS